MNNLFSRRSLLIGGVAGLFGCGGRVEEGSQGGAAVADAAAIPGVVDTPPPAVRAWDRNSMTLLGDSRLEQLHADSGRLRRNAFNFITVGLALSGQRMRVAANLAVSGARADLYLSSEKVDAALATNSEWLMIYGVLNDISQNSNTIDYWNASIRPVVETWINSGRKVILCTETGANDFASAAARGAVFKYNLQIVEFCRNNGGAVLFDIATIAMLPSAAMTLNPAYSGDGAHINLMPGAVAVGQAFADLVTQICTPIDSLVHSAGQVYANGGVQWFPNPLFLTTTGGNGSGIMSGPVPKGITAVIAPAGTAISNSIVPVDCGNALQMAIITTQGGPVKIQMDISGVALENEGDRFMANGVFSVDAGSSGFQWGAMHLQAHRGGVTPYVEDGIAYPSSGALPSTAKSWTSMTERLTIPTGQRGWFSAYAYLYFNGPGFAVVRLQRVGVWRQPVLV